MAERTSPGMDPAGPEPLLLDTAVVPDVFVAALGEWGRQVGLLRAVPHTRRAQVARSVVELLSVPGEVDLTGLPDGVGWVLCEFADSTVASSSPAAGTVISTARTLAAMADPTLAAPSWVERVHGSGTPARVPTGCCA